MKFDSKVILTVGIIIILIPLNLSPFDSVYAQLKSCNNLSSESINGTLGQNESNVNGTESLLPHLRYCIPYQNCQNESNVNGTESLPGPQGERGTPGETGAPGAPG